MLNPHSDYQAVLLAAHVKTNIKWLGDQCNRGGGGPWCAEETPIDHVLREITPVTSFVYHVPHQSLPHIQWHKLKNT